MKPPLENINFNLCQFILAPQLQSQPEATALEIISDNKPISLPAKWSFKDLDHAVRSIGSGLLNKGLKKGDFLLLRLTSDTPFALTSLAAMAVGVIPVLLSPQLTPKELNFFIKDTGARFMAWSPSLSIPEGTNLKLIKEDEIINFIANQPPADYARLTENDPAFLIYTSGTTSQPKGVLHAQRTIKGRIPMQEGWHQMQQGDRILHAGDFNWTYSLGIGLLDPWMWGATALIFSGKKTPDLWPELIRKHKPTIFAAVPGVYRQILKYTNPKGGDYQSLRHCLSAGETLPKDLLQQWHSKTGKHIYEALGQSEISTYASTAKGINIPETAMGRIQKGRKIAILPEENTNDQKAVTPLSANSPGLIAIHKNEPGLMLGYWQRPDEMQTSFRGDWFISGDSGTIDEENNLTHNGRIDDIMNASGYRVSPLEVEAALLTSDLISEAAVTSIKIREDLSIITAFIIPSNQPENREQADRVETSKIGEKLKAHLSNRLAGYKQPKSYIIASTLPRNKTGKILRKQLYKLMS